MPVCGCRGISIIGLIIGAHYSLASLGSSRVVCICRVSVLPFVVVLGLLRVSYASTLLPQRTRSARHERTAHVGETSQGDSRRHGQVDAQACDATSVATLAVASARELEKLECKDGDANAVVKGLRVGALDNSASLWHKLSNGEEITAAVLGSSVAADSGCTRALPHLAEKFPHVCGARVVEGNKPERGLGWARKVVDGLSARFPPRSGNGSHTLYNLGQPATGPRAFEHCLLDLTLPDMDTVDLYFLEFGVTAEPGSLDSIRGRSLLALASRLQALPSRPLVVLATFAHLCGACAQDAQPDMVSTSRDAIWTCPGDATAAPNALCPMLFEEPAAGPADQWPTYKSDHLKRDQVAALAERLDLPNVDLYTYVEDALRSRSLLVEELANDGVHPNQCGAELMATALLTVLDASHARWRCADEPPPTDVKPPQPAEMRRCFLFSHAPEDQPRGRSVYPNIDVADGFEYTPYADGGRNSNKPGLVARSAGAYVQLRLDTTRRVSDDAYLTFTYLTSYENMGAAKVTCVSGCTCQKSKLDAHAQVAMEGVRISYAATYGFLVSQGKSCIVRVEVLGGERPPNAGYKFKLIGISIGPAPGYHTEEEIRVGSVGSGSKFARFAEGEDAASGLATLAD